MQAKKAYSWQMIRQRTSNSIDKQVILYIRLYIMNSKLDSIPKHPSKSPAIVNSTAENELVQVNGLLVKVNQLSLPVGNKDNELDLSQVQCDQISENKKFTSKVTILEVAELIIKNDIEGLRAEAEKGQLSELLDTLFEHNGFNGTLLMLAVEKNNIDAITILVEHGALIKQNSTDDQFLPLITRQLLQPAAFFK